VEDKLYVTHPLYRVKSGQIRLAF